MRRQRGIETGRPLRVLRIIARLNVGGPAMQATTLAELLPPEEFEQRLLAGALAPGEADYLEVRDRHVPHVQVPGLGRAIRPTDDLRALVHILREIRRYRPDIVHTHTAKAGVLGRIAAITLRVPVRVHTFHGHLLDGYFVGWKRWLVITVERLLATRTTALVSVGARVGEELRAAHIGRPEQYRSIAPGVSLAPLPERAAARASLGLGERERVVLFVGRLTTIKRPDRLLDVAAVVASSVADVRFLVAGDGELRSALEARVGSERLPVTFLGWRGDIENLLAAADLALLTSDNEGMPVALIEAASCGVPAVATDVGSTREVVLDGRTGIVVPRTEVDELARAVARLCDDDELRARMGLAARTHADATLGRRRLADDYAALYRSLAIRAARP